MNDYQIIDQFLKIIFSKEEEAKVTKEETELKQAETAFDNFLQENDRLSMEAQKKYCHMIVFIKKDLAIKS